MARATVTFQGVWKKFRRGERHDSLRDLVPAALRRLVRRKPAGQLEREEFWAIRDVTFEVAPGEALGIIGPNGAGKSTTLKLLTRILRPTRGHCEIRGRVGALIEVAAGFHPDLTGRENIYLQGAIMGMKRVEIARKFDEIVEFAGVAEFIDTQVKRYSSGMNARLGFAIAAHLDPDVLLVDEVLSVGDADFQQRCVARMRAMLARGVPLVFVSHNLSAVVELCTRAIVLGRGAVVYDGSPMAAVREYRRVPWFNTGAAAASSPLSDSDIRISRVELLGEQGRPAETIPAGRGMTIRIHYQTVRPVARPYFAVDILSVAGTYCCGLNSAFDHQDFGTLAGPGWVDIVVPEVWLAAGCYVMSIGVGGSDGSHDGHPCAYPFAVTAACQTRGVVLLEHAWHHNADGAARSHAPADEARDAGGARALAPSAWTGTPQ